MLCKASIIRVIGGVSYWAYGLEQIRNKVIQVGAKLAVVPGDDKSDTQLMSYSTISKDAVDRIWAYFINGGVDNALNLIKYASYLLGQRLHGRSLPHSLKQDYIGPYYNTLAWKS